MIILLIIFSQWDTWCWKVFSITFTSIYFKFCINIIYWLQQRTLKPFKVRHTCSSTNMAGCCCSGSFLGSPALERCPSSGCGRHPSDPEEKHDSLSIFIFELSAAVNLRWILESYLELLWQQVVGVGLQFVQVGLKVTGFDRTGHGDRHTVIMKMSTFLSVNLKIRDSPGDATIAATDDKQLVNDEFIDGSGEINMKS